MKLDSNRAWKEASGNVSRNREALAAVAGVFFLLPQLALAIFYPQPEPTAGMSEPQIVALVQAYYISTLPVLVPMFIAQALGTLSLLSLLSHATRPTVGEALRLGLAGVLTYLGAQIVIGFGLGFGGGLLIGVLMLTGIPALAIAALLLVLVAAIAVAVRASLSGPVVAIEGERNPIRALRRSWTLTAGNAWRLLAFYALFLIAAMVIQIIVGVVVGIPLAMVASGMTLQLVTAVISSVASALVVLYLVAVVGAVHAQLAGTPAEQERRLFE